MSTRRIRDADGNLPPPPNVYNLDKIKAKAKIRQEAEKVSESALDDLALECVQAIKAGVSLTYVAEAAEVSRMTVHRWVKYYEEG